MPTITVKKLNEKAILPTYGSDFSAGADLYALIEGSVEFLPNETKLIPTGLAMEIPIGYAGLIYARSGLASKRGLAPANKVGGVDAEHGKLKLTVSIFGRSTPIEVEFWQVEQDEE